MTFLGKITLSTGLATMRTDELGEINLSRTALAAIGTTQAGPDFATVYKLSSRIQHGPFDNLPR
jgi:hypothetical protein